MALTIITDIESVSADLSSASLVDLTTYGGSNAARNTLALYLYLYKRDASLSDTAVTVSNTDPLNVTSWSFTLAGDGLYRAILFEFPIWAAGTYTVDSCVYYSGSYYRANTGTSQTPGGANWTLITDILATVLNLSGSGVTIGQTNNFTTGILEAGTQGDALQDLGPSIRSGKCKDWNKAADILYWEGLIDSAWMNFERGDYTEAQSIVDFITANWS